MELGDCSVDEIMTVLKELDDEILDLDENQKMSENSPTKKGKKRSRQPKVEHNEAAVPKKKTVARKKSRKDVMMALNFSHDVGTWVQCSSCGKWRYLKDVQESLSLSFQNDWVCSMNDDITRNSCDAPQGAAPEQEYAEIKFAPGSLVRAKLSGFPWWPAIVEYDPDEKKYVWFTSVESSVPSHYHVTFFGEPVTRSWIRTAEVIPYTKSETENVKKLSEKMSRWLNEAEVQGKEALPLSLKERLRRFSFAKRYKGRWRRSPDKPVRHSSDDNSVSGDSSGHKRGRKAGRMASDEKRLMEIIQDLDSFSSFDTDAFSVSDDQEIPDGSETEGSVLKEDCEFFGGKPRKKREKNNTKSGSEKFSITMNKENSSENSDKSDFIQIPKERKSKQKKEGSFVPPLKAQGSAEISKEKSKKFSKTDIVQKNETKKCSTFETGAGTSLKNTDFRQKITGNKKGLARKKHVHEDGKLVENSATVKTTCSHPQIPENNNKAKKKVKVLGNVKPKELKAAPISSYDSSIESVVQKWRCFLIDETFPSDNDISPEASSNKCVENSTGSGEAFCEEGHTDDTSASDGAQQPSEVTVLPPVTDEMRIRETFEMGISLGVDNTKSKTLKENRFSEFLEKKKSQFVVHLTDVEPSQEVSPGTLNDMMNTCVEEGLEVGNNNPEGKYRNEGNECNLSDTNVRTEETTSGDESSNILAKDGNERVNAEVTTLNDNNDRKEESKIKVVPETDLTKKSHSKQMEDKVGDKGEKQKGKRKFYVPPVRKD